MKALESMRLKLQPLRIYSLSESSVVDCELQAYAVGLDLAYDALTELQNESFVATATDYGILNRENQFVTGSQGTTEERRATILKLGAITPNDVTRADMERDLDAVGFNAVICENTADQMLYINCLGESQDETVRKAAIKAANLFLPAHLNAELDFRSISWNNIDQQDQSFDAKDGLDFTWDMVDRFENAMLQL